MTKPNEISLERGSGLLEREQKYQTAPQKPGRVANAFLKKNESGTVRVFVAGGSRAGIKKIYTDEAFRLGQEIGRHDYRLDFGLSSRGIMGAVARGVLDTWAQRDRKTAKPIHGVTTKEYLAMYQSDEVLDQVSDIIVAHTLEERKKQLLGADFVIFTPGGVGTLDELAYDCVAMQDGFLNFKPFVLYNVAGFFHHLLEYLKEVNAKGFSDPMPFIVVDNSLEAGIAFEMIGRYYDRKMNKHTARKAVERIIYDLPYIIEQKNNHPDMPIHTILDQKDKIMNNIAADGKKALTEVIETAYLNKEIERMYNRLAKTGQDTAAVSYKLSSLKRRSRSKKETK